MKCFGEYNNIAFGVWPQPPAGAQSQTTAHLFLAFSVEFEWGKTSFLRRCQKHGGNLGSRRSGEEREVSILSKP